ncbi:hypothetical protein ES706_03410 [subsurface metagenome]
MFKIKKPPKGLGILLLIGPALVWCSEYIGSGEVILATRNGAILGVSIIWVIVAGVFLKYWIGMSGARYTVCTGEGMIDMFSRIPGPSNWVVWVVLIAQFMAATISIGSIASVAGVFLSNLFHFSSYIGGWLVTFFALIVVWSGSFNWLKIVMSILVVIIIIGIFYVSIQVFPDIQTFLKGLIPHKPLVPEWALNKGVDLNPWKEMLPLIGWSAGGFASQVWYSYWVIGAGYGAAKANVYGEPADLKKLKQITVPEARKIKGWCRVLYMDATIAMLIGTVVTVGFLVAGAGILGPKELAPEGENVAIQLSVVFSENWGRLGGILFMIGGTAALIATQIGQLAGWPRLLADTFRICIPGYKEKFKWRTQFRMFLIFFLITNMIIVYTIGFKPVILVKLAAIMDGLLLTPLQAVCVGIGLFFVMPRLFSQNVSRILQPNWIFGLGLLLAFLVFGYFCIYQIPSFF